MCLFLYVKVQQIPALEFSTKLVQQSITDLFNIHNKHTSGIVFKMLKNLNVENLGPLSVRNSAALTDQRRASPAGAP